MWRISDMWRILDFLLYNITTAKPWHAQICTMVRGNNIPDVQVSPQWLSKMFQPPTLFKHHIPTRPEGAEKLVRIT